MSEHLHLEPYDESNAESVAHIIGADSATAKALTLLRQRRTAGETASLFIDNKNKAVVVVSAIPMIEDDPSDDEDRCELYHGEDKSDRCPNRAKQIIEEPYTPKRFQQRVCDPCAASQIDFGYRFVKRIEE